MIQNFRNFEAGPDPFGRKWQVTFVWQQNAISIRHADTIDVKFTLEDGELRDEKVIALSHPHLLALSSRLGRPLNDTWCAKLAAAHLTRMIESGEDVEKALVTMSMADMEQANALLN